MRVDGSGIERLTLTDLQQENPGLRRLAHGYATSGTWQRLVRRGANVLREVATALPRDLARRLTHTGSNLLRVEPGDDPQPGASRIALYVHYAPDGRISDMVRCQLRLLRDYGFAVVLITMAPGVPEDDWQALRPLCALLVHRRNFGLDFGAWRDLVPQVRQRWPQLQELMLANDSVMGPIYPLEPVIAALRAGGEGLFGLTESLQGGAHLQSYMLLARGPAAISDLLTFLQHLFVTHSKWLLVQMSEIRLARWMRRRGHRVAALYGYERLLHAALADPEQRRRLAASHAKLRGLEQMPDDEAEALLHAWPLNPTQHFWHLLATRFHSPFVKTELIRRNPGQLPGVDEWPAIVPPDAPCALPLLQAHLAAMGR
ncbi:MAG TPA: rhamnan synthesis F family protein [Rhodopila sp.]|nr:rhamnan synthesis F family protein [Rhodopila sp.]